MKIHHKLRLIVGALAVLAALGTVGLHLVEHWGWFDSFYMVLITLTTIGYSEVHPMDHAGRVLNVGIIVLGVSLVALLLGGLTQLLIEAELSRYLGRRRMEREIDRLKDHYIVCGAGRVGRSAALELSELGVPLVLIENHSNKAALAERWPTIVGDATKEAVLHQAHIERARGLVAATTTDAVNVYIVLTARGLNPELKIIARASEDDAEKHLLTAGADTVISPHQFAGHRIVQAFLQPHLLDFLDAATAGGGGRLNLRLDEIVVTAASGLAGASIATSQIRQRHGAIVLAIQSAEGPMRFNPSPEDRLQLGDHLIVMVAPTQAVSG